MEGVLVRRKANVFDETAAEPGRRPRRRGYGSDAGSWFAAGASEGVRGYVTSSARGRKHRDREVQRGGAVDRGSARTALHPTRQVPVPLRRSGFGCALGHGVMVVAKAEAGGSPSSEAPPGWLTGRETPQGGARSEASPGIGRFAGCSLRESVAEVGETHLSRGVTEPSEDGPRSREIARGDPPAFDEADQGSQRATGCGARQRT